VRVTVLTRKQYRIAISAKQQRILALREAQMNLRILFFVNVKILRAIYIDSAVGQDFFRLSDV
jgi:hypothetical protein